MNYKLYKIMKSLMLDIDDIETENLEELLKALSFAEIMNRRAAATAKEIDKPKQEKSNQEETSQTETSTASSTTKYTPTFEQEQNQDQPQGGVSSDPKFVGDYSRYGLGRNNIADLTSDEDEVAASDWLGRLVGGDRERLAMLSNPSKSENPYQVMANANLPGGMLGEEHLDVGNRSIDALMSYVRAAREKGKPIYSYRSANPAAGYRPPSVNEMNGVFAGMSPAMALNYDIRYRTDDGSSAAGSSNPEDIARRNTTAGGSLQSPGFARGAKDRFEILETALDANKVFIPELSKRKYKDGEIYDLMDWGHKQFVDAAKTGQYEAMMNPFTGEIVMLGTPGEQRNETIHRGGTVRTNAQGLGMRDLDQQKVRQANAGKRVPKRGIHSLTAEMGNQLGIEDDRTSLLENPEVTDHTRRQLEAGRNKNRNMFEALKEFFRGRERGKKWGEWAPERGLKSAIMHSDLKSETKSFLLKILK